MIGLADMIRQAAACSSQQKKAEDQRLGHLYKVAYDRHEGAKARYKKVLMGKGWVTTPEVEKLMGYKHGSCTVALKKLEEEGAIKKRPLNGEPFNRRRGWEYMWVNGDENDQD